ncbi:MULTISPECIES: hypothetical protein [unclassified Streptosporangium]|uniref:hypothetical protein n=1 Tax=unclassified Streptosporangium TaxID=2632669 RepID=UPI002E280C52|nr:MULTISPECIES: hypothetical protein [unclassified Streptosporangium]
MKHARRLVIASLATAALLVPIGTPAYATDCYQDFNSNYNNLRSQGYSHNAAAAAATITYEECLETTKHSPKPE